MSEWLDYRDNQCPVHGLTTGSVYRCTDCEDGVIDRYEEDPLWFDEDTRYELCETCEGRSSWWVCSECAKEPH